MKTIGLIGGVSWTSTEEYYKRLNERVYEKFGGYNSAKILLYSFNFAEILHYQQNGDAKGESELLISQAKRLENAGAELLLICSNTTNKTASEVKNHIKIPLLELIPLTAKFAVRKKFSKLGLLGTTYVMYGEFYKKIFSEYGLEVIVPPKNDGYKVHDIIYNELVKEKFYQASTKILEHIANDFKSRGADAVILGCTELPLVIKSHNVGLPILDTIDIHVNEALKIASE